MLQHYQDARAIGRKFGKPDLSITMTCNPNWCEVQKNVLFEHTASGKSNIVSSVFNVKKDTLNTIVKEKLFIGEFAHEYVVEYQKRELIHVHFVMNTCCCYVICNTELNQLYNKVLQ